MTPLEVLVKARELISDPSKWTTGKNARSSNRLPVHPTSDNAVCFCSYGAVSRVTGDPDLHDGDPRAIGYLDDAAEELFNKCASDVNDDMGHECALAVYDRAIELARAA